MYTIHLVELGTAVTFLLPFPLLCGDLSFSCAQKLAMCTVQVTRNEREAPKRISHILARSAQREPDRELENAGGVDLWRV